MDMAEALGSLLADLMLAVLTLAAFKLEAFKLEALEATPFWLKKLAESILGALSSVSQLHC